MKRLAANVMGNGTLFVPRTILNSRVRKMELIITFLFLYIGFR